MKPDERQLDLLALLLAARRPVHSSEIYRHLGYEGSKDTRERKLSRDKEALREMGIPIEYVQGETEEDSGYLVDRERLFMPVIPLEPAERAALFAVGAAAQAGAFPARGELSFALTKLGALERSVNVGVGAAPSRRPDIEATMMQAVREHRRLKIVYGETERLVDPYTFSARGGRSRLVAFCHLRRGIRTFVTSQVRACALATPGAKKPEFEIPAGFDPAPHLPRHPWQIHVGEEVEVQLSFSPEMRESGPRQLGIPPQGRVRTRNVEGLLSQLLALGEGVKVVSPPEVKERLLSLIDSLLGAHGATR